jgi:twinkle protein
MNNFAKRTDSLLLLIAHPTKMSKDEKGKYLIPGPYNISGSADFLNMADYTFTVHRNQDDEGKYQSFGTVVVQKTKINKTLGDTGTWPYLYNINNGRYLTDHMTGELTKWDNSNWITKEEYIKPIENEYKVPTATINDAFGEYDDTLPF